MSDGHLTQSSAPGQDTSPSSMLLLYPIVTSGSLIFITNKATSNDQAFCVTTTLKIWNFAFWKWHSLLQFIFLITFYVHFLAKVIFILDKRPPTWLLPWPCSVCLQFNKHRWLNLQPIEFRRKRLWYSVLFNLIVTILCILIHYLCKILLYCIILY